MIINILNPHGFCFGVTRAIELAKTAAKNSVSPVYLLGEIVHNPFVVADLKNNFNLETVSSLDQIPNNSTVIFRAHGSSPELYQQAKNMGLHIVDATCPLVSKSHQIIKKFINDSQKIIFLVSDYHHDEAVAVLAQAPSSIQLVTLADALTIQIPDPLHTVVLTQTTLSVLETKKTLDFLSAKFPELTIHPHICPATTERQKAIIDSATDSDLIIIIGAKNSSNCQRLYDTALTVCQRAQIIESADDLSPNLFIGVNRLSLTSAASTPENIFTQVIEKIKNFNL